MTASASLPPLNMIFRAVFLPKANRVKTCFTFMPGAGGRHFITGVSITSFCAGSIFRAHVAGNAENFLPAATFSCKVLLQAFLFSLQWRVALQQADL